MAVRFVYMTTEEKILSGDNREILQRLRPGFWPTVNLLNQVIVTTWKVSEDIIRNYLLGPTKHNRGVVLFIDADHPQLSLWLSVENPKQKMVIVSNGKTDHPIEDDFSSSEPQKTMVILSASSSLVNYSDVRNEADTLLLYKPLCDNVEDVGSEGLLSRLLLSNRQPVKFVWHCENVPEDIKTHGLGYFRTYFDLHYPDTKVEIETFGGDDEQLLDHLKARQRYPIIK